MSPRGPRGGAGHTATEETNSKSPQSTSGHFDRTALPTPSAYLKARGRSLRGGGEWRTTCCTLCNRPEALKMRTSGAFRCTGCGARGRDVLALYRLETGASFEAAARANGAWREGVA